MTITHEEVDDILENEKRECRNEFMSQKNFYRSALIGILTCLTVIGSAIAWAINDVETTTRHSQIIKEHGWRINRIEDQITAQHKEQMRVLIDIKKRVDDK